MSHIADARDIFRGVLASLFGFGGRLIARAMLVIFAGRAFGMEAFGHLGQVAAITEITAAICVLGLKRSLLDMLSFHAEQGIAPERRMMEALLLAGFVGLIIGGALCFVWVQLFPETPKLIPFLFLGVPAIVITDVALTAIKFKRVIRWDVMARCVAEPWTFLILAVIMWHLSLTETGLIFAYAGSVFAACLCAVIGLSNVVGVKPLIMSKPSVRSWPCIVRQSLPVGITDIGVMSIRRLDLIVLSFIAGPAAAGLYYMAQQVVTIPQKINALFEPMLSPVMAKLHNQKNAGQIRDNLMGVCRWIFIFQFAITIPLIVFSDNVMNLFGAEFKAGAIVLCVLLIAELIDGTFISVETPLIYARPRIPPTLLMLALLTEVTLIAALSYVWGAEGAALGFLITLSCLALARLFMLKKHLQISVLSKSYIVPAFTGLIMAVALWALRDLQTLGPLVNVAGIVISLVLFATIIKIFAMTKSDRTLFRALSRRKKRAVS